MHALWLMIRHPIMTARIARAVQQDLKGLPLEEKARRAQQVKTAAEAYLAKTQEH